MRNNIIWVWSSACAVLLLSWVFSAQAVTTEFLDPEQAFIIKADLNDASVISINWAIAPGYKLYRESLHFTVDGNEPKLGEPVLPDGIRKLDPNLNRQVETYHDQLAIALPIAQGKAPFILKVKYQGCAEAGLCYPPIVKSFNVDPAHPGILSSVSGASAASVASNLSAPSPKQSATVNVVPKDDSAMAQKTLKSGSLTRIGLAFLGFGLLLSLTPCVLPMVPILSSIIVGEGMVTRRRGFLLAGAYSLGMALVYTTLGVAAGLAGEGLAAALQKPWVLVIFALLLIGLALSMFDVYQLQLPAAIQTRLSLTSDRLKGGRFASVFVMGALSALIIGPCVAAPLAGALVYISQTHNVLIGGWALFAMAVGMSFPLLLTGLSAGSLLPHAGAWMNEVKHVFGLMLIAVAIWMVTPILPTWAILLAWGSLAIFCAVFLRAFDALPTKAGIGSRFTKAAGLVFLIAGVFELFGAASGGQDVLQPLAHIRLSGTSSSTVQPETRFVQIHNIAELESALHSSKTPVLLDFYADWCVACKEMERLTFNNEKVAEQLSHITLLQANVTANSPDDRALMKKFELFGPPGIILFNNNGKEVPQSRIIGYLDAETFLENIKQHLANAGLTT